MSKTVYIALFFLASLLFSCEKKGGKFETPKQKIVRINFKNEPHTLDPRKARDANSMILLRMLFEGLTRISPKEQPELALASHLEISADLTTYTFTLRPSFWSNGKRVTASDFVHAWRTLLHPSFPSPYASHLYSIKQGKEIKMGRVPPEELGAKAIDDFTLVVELEEPLPYFLELLSLPPFFPICSQTDTKVPNWAEESSSYVCNGPFSMKSWQHQYNIKIEKNLKYWDAQEVHIDGIELAMVDESTELLLFEKGELDWVGSPLSTIPTDALVSLKKGGRLYVQPAAGTAFIRINLAEGVLGHPKIRHALALAIDRKALTTHVTMGGQLPATSLVPPSQLPVDTPLFPDGASQRAKELLNEAIEELQLEGEFPPFTLSYASSERAHLVCQAIQEQWRKSLGIRVALEAIEWKVYFDRIAHTDYQLALSSWSADFNDPINFLDLFRSATSGFNHTGWEEKRYQLLLDSTGKIKDPTERSHLLKQSASILIDAMPIIPLYHYSMVYMKQPNLSGALISSMGNLDFKSAVLENPK